MPNRRAPRQLTRFNETVARRATLAFGTMWAFYVLTVYSLVPVVFPWTLTQLLYWSNCIQLIALPLLMVGTNLLGRNSERRARETHDAVMEELRILRDMTGAATGPDGPVQP